MATLTSDLAAVAKQAANVCKVPSFSTPGKSYACRDVFTPWASCDCEDFRYRRQKALGEERCCKHIAWARSGIDDVWQLAVLLRLRTEDPVATLTSEMA